MLRKENFIEGEYYHIYNRGIDKRIVCKSIYDYQRLTSLLYIANSKNAIRLDDYLKKRGKPYADIFTIERGDPLVSIGAWCLMGNHFHLLVREETAQGISTFMKKLGTGYSMYFNKKYHRTGGLFGGPFKSNHISTDTHLRHMYAYIHLNPLDIKFSGWEQTIGKKSPDEWRNFLANYEHSSFGDYVGVKRPEQHILHAAAFPDYFSEHADLGHFIDSYLMEF